MAETFKALIKTARPRQWLKNISLFTGLVFTGWLFIPDKFLQVLFASFAFSILTSAVYIFNDILDIPRDKMHPFKNKRPLASGELSIEVASFWGIILIVVSLWWAYNISFFFFLIELVYLILQFAYTLWLKKQPILDVMTIATGFILRVYAGAIVINSHINVWLLLCVISFALFLAIGKRRSERTLLGRKVRQLHRESLVHYPEKLLDAYTTMFANTTWLTYALFSFQQPSNITHGPVLSLFSVVPRALVNEKLLMLTVPIVIYGVMRYLQLIYDQDKGESPAEVLLADRPLILVVFIWGLLVVMILYVLR